MKARTDSASSSIMEMRVRSAVSTSSSAGCSGSSIGGLHHSVEQCFDASERCIMLLFVNPPVEFVK